LNRLVSGTHVLAKRVFASAAEIRQNFGRTQPRVTRNLSAVQRVPPREVSSFKCLRPSQGCTCGCGGGVAGCQRGGGTQSEVSPVVGISKKFPLDYGYILNHRDLRSHINRTRARHGTPPIRSLMPASITDPWSGSPVLRHGMASVRSSRIALLCRRHSQKRHNDQREGMNILMTIYTLCDKVAEILTTCGSLYWCGRRTRRKQGDCLAREHAQISRESQTSRSSTTETSSAVFFLAEVRLGDAQWSAGSIAR